MLPLAGITVVALEHAVAGPFCTRQLADYGARVIKVERPAGGDFGRGYDEKVNGLASYFVWLNRGKESVTLRGERSSGSSPARTCSCRTSPPARPRGWGSTSRR
jgi:itaconate CoA-transferase